APTQRLNTGKTMKSTAITLLVVAAAFAGAQSTVKTPPTTGAEPTTTIAPAKPTTKTYTSEELGLSFDYPANWKKSAVMVKNHTKFTVTDPKSWKPARTENTTRFLMPLPGTDEKGTLEIYSIQFNADTDIGESSQRDINAQLKRTVVKQWKEEVLGVPLLMTKIESTDKNEKLLTETGMIYSATARKLVFRVAASPENFDKADAQWREVMQSVRMADGRLPSAEDPGRRLTPAEINPGAYRK